MVRPAHKLAGRDKGSMWDQLEDAAMETFSIINHLSVCVVHPSSFGGTGPHLEAAGAGGRNAGSGVASLMFPLLWNL